MRTIQAQAIADTVAQLCIRANLKLPADVSAALENARKSEPWPLAKSTLDLLGENLVAADKQNMLFI